MRGKKILVIVGPTSSGKSTLAVKLARKLDGEIISADSRQVYKELNIGTGKITKREMKGIRHHLLDVVSPKTVFTAANFVVRGRAALEDILRRGKMPIICGGTGFYIDALLGRIDLPNVPPNRELRMRLEKKSAAALHAMLKKMDPRRAHTIDGKNPVRLIRAIEIAKRLGRVPPTIKTRKRESLLYVTWIGIKPSDEILRKKIHVRLLARMRQGMIAEAKRLHAGGLSYKRMERLGLEYRYLARFLQGKITKSAMLIDLERDIWRYAKRQMTYWRRNDAIRWYTPRNIRSAKKDFFPSSPSAQEAL